MGQSKSDLISPVTSERSFNSYQMFFDKTIQRWPFKNRLLLNKGERIGWLDCTVVKVLQM